MPQQGIFKHTEISNSGLFLEYRFNSDTDIKLLKSNLLELYKMNSDSLNIVLSLSKNAFNLLNAEAPEGLVDFTLIEGVNNLKMPSVQSDLFILAHSESKGEVFDFSLQTEYLLSDLLQRTTKQEGFKYHESRDVMGFVDGSANPKDEKRKEAALVPATEKHANGSYVLTQKWVHNLKTFHANPVKVQEEIIGRTKKDSIELEGDAMPNNSHVSRTDASVNGEALKIYRRSYPFANDDEHGLFFLGFSKNIMRFDVQLRRMVGDTQDKISDRMMEFSVPKTGAYYFAPSHTELTKILNN